MSTDSTVSAEQPRKQSGLRESLGEWIADWGGAAIDSILAVGDIGLFAMQTFSWLFTRLPKRDTLLPIFYQVGVLSLPVVALTGSFIGMVSAVQSHFQFNRLNLETQLGAVINTTLARELGPVLAATMLAGRVGSAIAAELGTMRVTEQIDALDSMGSNPIHYLVVPRFLAFVMLIPALTIMAVFMGVVGGYFYSVLVLGIDKHHYVYNTAQYVDVFALFHGLFKSFFFGVAIAIISCYQGFHCKAGAEGVGRASTSAFVQSFVLILVLDLLLGITLDRVQFILWPDGGGLL